MTREELEHAIRAACEVSGDSEVYVFGSQAILGQFPNASEFLRQSAEVDIAPVHAVDVADIIDGALGELSAFHQAHGFYVHGLSIEAAVLPRGSERRAVRVKNRNTDGNAGLCVEAHDLAASKLVAFRPKDRDFVRVLIADGLVDSRKLVLRIRQVATSRTIFGLAALRGHRLGERNSAGSRPCGLISGRACAPRRGFRERRDERTAHRTAYYGVTHAFIAAHFAIPVRLHTVWIVDRVGANARAGSDRGGTPGGGR
jgi:hypothetical protein